VLALGAGPTVVRYLPPLVISAEQIDAVIEATAAALADVDMSVSVDCRHDDQRLTIARSFPGHLDLGQVRHFRHARERCPLTTV